jgi:hypothetical protein
LTRKYRPELIRYKILIAALLFLLYGCAQVMAPTGGPRDTEPPRIVSCNPPDGAVNQKEGKIEIRFNEFIQVKDAGTWLTSPPQKQAPEYKIKGKTLEVSLRDSLKTNTTYSISFGNSITDFTEGNAMPAFKYIFSTGPRTDSLIISGKALNIHTGKAEKDISIFLYSLEKTRRDSFLFKSEPDYFASAGETGLFLADHLPAGGFVLAVVGDKNKNFKYDPPDEWIGYAEKAVITVDSAQSNPTNIRYFKTRATQYLKKSDNSKPSFFFGQFNRSFNNPVCRVADRDDSLLIVWGKNKDSISVWDLSLRRDSMMMLIYDEMSDKADTLNIRFKKTATTANRSGQGKRNRLILPPASFPNGAIRWKRKPGETIQVIYENPVRAFDAGLTELVVGKERMKIKWKQDVADLRKISPEIPEQFRDSSLKIILLPGAVMDWYSQKNDTLKLESSAGALEDYGNLNINLSGAGEKSLVVELMNDQSQTINKQTVNLPVNLNYTMIEPGNYHLKIIEDKNSNGRWDEGQPEKLIPPERIILPEKIYEIRANWDMEEELLIKD